MLTPALAPGSRPEPLAANPESTLRAACVLITRSCFVLMFDARIFPGAV